jgi:hypothetical protein
MNKLILILTTLCFLAGCGTTKGYEEILRTWVGHNANDLVASWGYPKNSFKAPNGNTVTYTHRLVVILCQRRPIRHTIYTATQSMVSQPLPADKHLILPAQRTLK